MTSIVIGVIGLFVLGLGLLAAEILVIPGFGLIGLLGFGAGVAAIALAFVELGELWGAVTLVGGVLAFGGLAWLLPRTRAGKAMVLTDAHTTRAADNLGLLGAEGETVTQLRPAGSARLAGKLVDVVADGIFVEAGTRVRVTRVEGARVLVEPLA
jgi:membrane-bound serine protease (ClpP class)